MWTFNMPTDHGRISMKDVRVPHASIFGGEGQGLAVVQHFFNENRIRQAASSVGAAHFASTNPLNTRNTERLSASRCRTTRAYNFR